MQNTGIQDLAKKVGYYLIFERFFKRGVSGRGDPLKTGDLPLPRRIQHVGVPCLSTLSEYLV